MIKPRRTREPEPVTRKAIRCAIYTRKSTEEGLDQDFNSLDAQRESAEAYIRSQAHEGWKLVPTRYDDWGGSLARASSVPEDRQPSPSPRRRSLTQTRPIESVGMLVRDEPPGTRRASLVATRGGCHERPDDGRRSERSPCSIPMFGCLAARRSRAPRPAGSGSWRPGRSGSPCPSGRPSRRRV